MRNLLQLSNKFGKKGNFNIFLCGQFLSGLSSEIVQFAIIWYITAEYQSGTMLAMGTLTYFVPAIFVSPFAGAVIDRFDKKLILILSDAVSAGCAVMLVSVSLITGSYPVYLVFVSIFVHSVANAFQIPAIGAVTPQMVEEDYLTKANGQLTMIDSANMIAAPGISAFLYAFIPMNILLLFDVVGFILGVSMLLITRIPKTKFDPAVKMHVISDAKEGLKILMNVKAIFYLTLGVVAFNIVSVPMSSLFPLMTTQYLGGSVADAGFVEIAYNVGMLAGGAIVGILGVGKNRIFAMTFSCLIDAIFVFSIAFVPQNFSGIMMFCIFNMISGVTLPFYLSSKMSLIQQAFPNESLGKVLGAIRSLSTMSGPIGLIFAGPISDAIGVNNIFIIGGIGAFAFFAFLIVCKPIRAFEITLANIKAAEAEVSPK